MDQSEVITSRLEEALIYSCIVAGKSATFTDAVMGRWQGHRQKFSSFEFIRILVEEENLAWVLRDIRCGNYTKLAKCFEALAKSGINLANCLPEDLEAIHGIGPKTSRFFILWTRPGARYAALDVHILRWLRNNGYPKAPKSTPPKGKLYAKWEAIFLAKCDELGKEPRELDAEIWRAGSGYQN